MKIIADQLVKTYKGRNVVDGVSFEVNQGEVVGLLGPNGAGKTTTFYMIIGLIKPNAGQVRFDDLDVTAMPMYRRARAGVGYLPQETSVFRRLSVRDNIRLVMEINGANPKTIRQKTEELAEELHIERILDRTAGILSGGERRRVEIARALSTDPKFILLDEPFTGIDEATTFDLMGVIEEMHQQGQTVLAVLHDNQRVADYFPQTLLLAENNACWGHTHDVLPAFESVRRA